MADDKEAPKPVPKKEAKKPASKAKGYVVAEGRSIQSAERLFLPGETITAADVHDLERLVKGGYVVEG